ncbi:MAG: acyl-CoA dehydrogenase family protein, partial [Candidatus Methylomirabilis sp.]|nr:acyl-CoA dehydrogenase family protein [Deltaproteobacteria bacterium]
MIDFSLSEEQQLIVDTVRDFAAGEIHPAARKCEEKEEPIPDALVQGAWQLGLILNTIPESFGGGGEPRSAVTGALITEELAKGDLALALHLLSPNLAVLPVLEFGSDAQKAAHLPRYAGEKFAAGSVAIVEPSMHYGPLDLATTATKKGANYVLKGKKCFVPVLDDTAPILVFAKEGDAVQGFFVERNAGGMKIEPEKNMGLNALNLCEIAFEECAVPASARLGEAGT